MIEFYWPANEFLAAQPCMNQDSCYPLAFGVPAVLMVIATIIFTAGSFWYKKVPPKENVFAEVFHVIKVSTYRILMSK